MAAWAEFGFGWACVSCFFLTVASAVFPWISAEIVVLALPAVARSPLALVALVGVATAGQMTGKSMVYWAGRAGSGMSSLRVKRSIDRWQGRFSRGRSSPMALVFLSSAVGFPPFFVVTAMAGAVRVKFSSFMIAGTIGRLLRFGALVFVPKLIVDWFH